MRVTALTGAKCRLPGHSLSRCRWMAPGMQMLTNRDLSHPASLKKKKEGSLAFLSGVLSVAVHFLSFLVSA